MKSSAQLQREAQMQRASLSTTLDRLGDSLQPSNLTTEAVTLAKDSGLSIAKSLAESARANPIPAMLIGVGLTMLLTKDSSVGGGDLLGKAGDFIKNMTSSGASAVRHAGESVNKAAHSVADTARETAGAVRDKVTGAVGSATHATEDAAHKLSDQASSLRASAEQKYEIGVDGIRRAVHDGEDQARKLAEDGRRYANEGMQAIEKLAHEQPILMAALGAAIGAVAGSLFPVTETEKKYMGDVGAKATAAGRDTFARVAEVVKKETLGDHPEKQIAAVADKMIGSVTKELGGKGNEQSGNKDAGNKDAGDKDSGNTNRNAGANTMGTAAS